MKKVLYVFLFLSSAPCFASYIPAGLTATGVNASTVAVVNSAGTKLLVTPDSVALPANQSMNESQINGVTPLMGNGPTGTGSQRVTISSDQTQFAVLSSTSIANSVGGQVVFVSTFANVSASTTDGILVSTISATAKICVHEVTAVTGATATNVTFNTKPGTSGTAISALFANAANGGFVLPWSPIPWFCTNVNASLSVTTGTGSATGISIVYGQE